MNDPLELFLIQVIIYVLIFGPWLLALTHAMQRIENPTERTTWLLLFFLLTVIAPLIYFLVRYRGLRKEGKGGFIKAKSKRG